MAEFGSGLASDTADYGAPPEGADAGTLFRPGISAPAPPQAQGQAQPQASFGSGLFGPRYTPPDPKLSALDQSAALLEQRVKRASDVATNPVAQFLYPEIVQKARDFVPQAAEQLQRIQQQKAQQVEIGQFAKQYNVDNIPPGADRETAKNMVTNELQQRFHEGDPLAAAQLTQLGRQDLVQAGSEQAISAAAANNQRYRDAIGKLANAQNPGQYAAAYGQIVQETKNGVHEDHELASVPKTFEEFQAKKQLISNALSVQQLQIESAKARMQQLGGVAPIQKTTDKEGNATGLHAVTAGSYRDQNGNPMSGTEPVTVGGIYNGNRLPIGSPDIGAGGEKWGLMTKEELKGADERLKPHKTTLERTAGIDKLEDIASQKDFGTNSWLLGHGIEQFVEISRNGVGGKGSATPGTIQIMENLRGRLQTASDKAAKEWGRVVEWVDNGKKGTQPYLSAPTIDALKSAIVTLKEGSDKETAGVAGGIAYEVGRHGGKLSDMAVEPGVTAALKPFWDRGNADFKADLAARPSVVVGSQRVIFDPDGPKPATATVPGGFAPAAPPPSGSPGGGAPPAAPNPPSGLPGSGPAGGGAPSSVDRVFDAIHAQESGSGRNTSTSVTGARGNMQIQPGTWAQYAKPGEKIDDPADNKAVGRRIIEDLSAKSGGDPARIAVGYFSGPGNIAPPGSPTPWKTDRADPTGKTVSSYVADITRRLDKGGAAPESPGIMQRLASGDVPGGRATTARARESGIESAPAIGSILGAAGGSVAGPAGTIAGGAAGGGAGQAFKDYMQGTPQSPVEIAKQTALGGVLGVASAARPIASAAARVAGVGGIEAGAEAAGGGSPSDVIKAGATGAGLALGGEALGRFIASLGPAAHRLLSKFTPEAQGELSAQAGKLAEARKTLETEQPKLAGEGAGPNPKYEAAKKTQDEATQYIKDHSQNPDDMVYAYEQTKAGTSAGEAQVLRGANKEKAAVSEGYDKLRQDIGEAGVGAVKPKNVPDGPVSKLRTAENPTGAVPEQFRPQAEHAEMLVTAPAKNWGDKWQQLQNAGSELIKQRMAFLANNDKPSAEAMDALFKGVRAQQKAAAEYVFGKEKGAQVIKELEGLDTRYAKIMNATQGMNYEKMRTVLASGNTPERRELEKNFREFAKGDPAAIRAFNAMKAGARGDWKSEAALMTPVIAGEVANSMASLGLPVGLAGAAMLGGHRLYKVMQGYMNARVLGTPVQFKDFLARELKSNGVNPLQRAAVQ